MTSNDHCAAASASGVGGSSYPGLPSLSTSGYGRVDGSLHPGPPTGNPATGCYVAPRSKQRIKAMKTRAPLMPPPLDPPLPVFTHVTKRTAQRVLNRKKLLTPPLEPVSFVTARSKERIHAMKTRPPINPPALEPPLFSFVTKRTTQRLRNLRNWAPLFPPPLEAPGLGHTF